MSWCPDTPYLITCCQGGRTICWNMTDRQIVYEMEQPMPQFFDVQWCPDITGIISASSSNGDITLYDIEGFLHRY